MHPSVLWVGIRYGGGSMENSELSHISLNFIDMISFKNMKSFQFNDYLYDDNHQ